MALLLSPSSASATSSMRVEVTRISDAEILTTAADGALVSTPLDVAASLGVAASFAASLGVASAMMPPTRSWISAAASSSVASAVAVALPSWATPAGSLAYETNRDADVGHDAYEIKRVKRGAGAGAGACSVIVYRGDDASSRGDNPIPTPRSRSDASSLCSSSLIRLAVSPRLSGDAATASPTPGDVAV